MTKKNQNFEPQLLFIELNSENFKPFFIGKKYGTVFTVFGKITTKKSNDGNDLLDEIHLKYKRISGLINFSFNTILNIDTTDNDPILIKPTININVQLRAFTKKKKTTSLKLPYDIPVKVEDFIHLKFDNEIINLDPNDDISGKLKTDQIDICFNKITNI